eukprot:3193569-Pyramimonas_sp.AAC.1
MGIQRRLLVHPGWVHPQSQTAANNAEVNGTPLPFHAGTLTRHAMDPWETLAPTCHQHIRAHVEVPNTDPIELQGRQ